MGEDTRNQDKNAFLEAAYRHRERLIQIARYKLGSLDDAEDAVNEAILRAAAKRHQLRDSSKLAFWLARIVVNQCNDMIRKRRGDASLDDLEPYLQDTIDTSNPAAHVELIDQIEGILDEMLFIEPEEFAEVLVLFFYQKLSYKEIGERLGVPVGTVKSRLTRARDVLQQRLRNKGVTVKDLDRIQDLSRWPEIRFLE